ncbi:hypothetical protein DFH09DRAFT_901650, partial [Mycena vulgaris]
MSSTPTDATSHASRNPTKEVQEARQRKKGEPLSDSQKASRAQSTRDRQITAEDFAVDVDAFYAYRGKVILELATKYHRTPEYIKGLLINASQFKTTRNVSLRNAVMHDISTTAKAGKLPVFPPPSYITDLSFLEGKTIHITELHTLADEAIVTGFTKEEEEQLIETLREAREHKRVGVRASNVAAAVDTRSTVSEIQDEIMSLYERTGTRGIAFFTRGHLDDSVMPTVVQSGDAIAFCVEVLKKPAIDIVRLFEQWSCSRAQENVQRDNRQSLCAQISRLIEEKLHAIILNDTVSMSYVNMDVDIKEAWKVEIVGWPTDIAVMTPSKIKAVERLRRIRDGWLNGTIHWVTMSLERIQELAVDLEERRAQNDGVLKKRKTRADAGIKRKGKRSGEKRHGKQKGPPNDDDEEEQEEQDEDDEEEDEVAVAARPSRAKAARPSRAKAATTTAAHTSPASNTIGSVTIADSAPSTALNVL